MCEGAGAAGIQQQLGAMLVGPDQQGSSAEQLEYWNERRAVHHGVTICLLQPIQQGLADIISVHNSS